MATNLSNRVSVRKTFALPETFAKKRESLVLPRYLATSQTYKFTIVNADDSGNTAATTMIGTIAKASLVYEGDDETNVADVVVTLTPVWYANGPSYPITEINLSTVESMDQMYIAMVQDKQSRRNSIPQTATRYKFMLNGHPVEMDDYSFLKVVYRDTDKSKSIYGYITDVEYDEELDTQVINLSCIELNGGIASYYKASIDVKDLVCLYRYCIECEVLTHKPKEDRKATPKADSN